MKQRPDWALKLPGSKSITNRMFLCAAFAKGVSRIYGALKSDDSDVMLRALKKLGVKINERKDFIEISGTGGKFKSGKITLDLHNAGTAVRFLTAAMILRKGETIITGDRRMRGRPIKDLVDGLIQLGANARYLRRHGCPPISIKSCKRSAVSCQPEYIVKMRGDKSSQYFSALLMLGPCLSKPLKIEVIGELVSKPYIDVTLNVLRQFGIRVQNNDYKSFVVRPQAYKSGNYTVEGDATSASYWTSIAYLHGGKVRFSNLSKKCVQGDIKYENVLKSQMSNVKGQRLVDITSMPDTAMTLAVTAPFMKGQTKITGLSTLRIKETDRIKALETELNKVGVKVSTTKDSITIEGHRTKDSGHSRTQLSSESCVLSPIKTYDDHRIAMSFAVLGTMIPGVIIENPKCTEKTYPDFWKDLELAYLNPVKLGQKNLVLTGMRCSGKTYLGKKIARMLKRKFVDLDIEIERCVRRTPDSFGEKMKIEDIIKRYGWPYFRKLEQKICSQFSSRKNIVIATGGGVVLDEKNMKNLKKNGVNIFIFADPSVIAERIKHQPKKRPTLTGKGSVQEVKSIWKERRDLYIKYADIVWDNTSGKIAENNLTKIFI